MKKRAMKKWIPNGVYCHGSGTKKNPYCKWRVYLGTIERNRGNCKYSDTCTEVCNSTPNTNCYNEIYRCDYLKYTDFINESLLWDACKECGVKDK